MKPYSKEYLLCESIENLKIGKTWRTVMMEQGKTGDSWGACDDLFLEQDAGYMGDFIL